MRLREALFPVCCCHFGWPASLTTLPWGRVQSGSSSALCANRVVINQEWESHQVERTRHVFEPGLSLESLPNFALKVGRYYVGLVPSSLRRNLVASARYHCHVDWLKSNALSVWIAGLSFFGNTLCYADMLSSLWVTSVVRQQPDLADDLMMEVGGFREIL